MGTKAFCSGGDQALRTRDGYADYENFGRLNVQIRRLPKPVIAMVAGYAVGGGHVLHMVCDLTIVADNAIFGQTGAKVLIYGAKDVKGAENLHSVLPKSVPFNLKDLVKCVVLPNSYQSQLSQSQSLILKSPESHVNYLVLLYIKSVIIDEEEAFWIFQFLR
ncbi:hypothetical protein WN944_011146 [Citrus x changshan-huyou]|uniref:Uncharacterized protein n=1 Tax=Citrus x changshan-huyou TaxID=2935761 RepID=A0AAP0MVH6_9ROSI